MSGKNLTLETIIIRTKTDKINCIKSLNLWGNDLEDVSCLVNVPNLEVVSLSVNKIKTLKPFSKLAKLRDLYLRNNKISTFSEINYLKNNANLRVLTLNENPISDLPNYRKKVIQLLPQLVKFDEKVITIEEKTMTEDEIESGDEGTLIEDNNQEEHFDTFNKKNTELNAGNKKPPNNIAKKLSNVNDMLNSKDNSGFNSGNVSDDIYSKKSENLIKQKSNITHNNPADNRPLHINRKLENDTDNSSVNKPLIKNTKSDNTGINKGGFNRLKSSQIDNPDKRRFRQNEELISSNNYNNQEDEMNFVGNNYNDYKKRNTEIIENKRRVPPKNSNDNSDESYYNNQYSKYNNNRIKNDYPMKENLENRYDSRYSKYNDDDEREIIRNKRKTENIKNIKKTNNPNIVKSITLLLDELSFNDMIVLKEQVDSKLFSLGNNNKIKYNPNAYNSNCDDDDNWH